MLIQSHWPGTVALSAVMLVFGRTAKKKDVLTMVVRGEKEQVGSVQEVFSHTPGSTIQSKNLFQDSFELVYELRVPESVQENLLLLLGSMEGVHGVNVLAPQTKVA